MKLRAKPSGIYVLDYETEGTRRRVSLGTRDPVEARRRARRVALGLDPEPGAPAQPAPTKATTIADLLDHTYRTQWREVKAQATILSNIRVLTRLVGTTPAAAVTDDTIVTLRERMEAEGSSPGTVKRKLDTLFKALKVGLRWDGGNGTGVPVLARLPERPEIKVKNLKDRIISPEEQAALFEAVRKRVEAEPTRDWQRYGVLLRFLLDTGCRLAEALSLNQQWIETEEVTDPETGETTTRTWVTFPRYTTKNDKPRRLPLTAACAAELATVLPRAINGNVFPLKAATAWYMWDGLREDLGPGWEDVVLHTFRHTCLTFLAKRLPIHKVSLWAGHSDISITMRRYAHLQSEDLLACVDALDATLR